MFEKNKKPQRVTGSAESKQKPVRLTRMSVPKPLYGRQKVTEKGKVVTEGKMAFPPWEKYKALPAGLRLTVGVMMVVFGAAVFYVNNEMDKKILGPKQAFPQRLWSSSEQK